MAILVSKLKSDLRPWLLARVPSDMLDSLQDSDFVAIWNYVARDINDLAQLRTEIFSQKCAADNAEEATLRNYLLQGVIKKIFKVEVSQPYIDGNYQQYTYTSDRFVLRYAPSANSLLTILYLRDIEEVSIADESEVDLPNEVYHEYLDLIKSRILADYNIESGMDYQAKLVALIPQIRRKQTNQETMYGEVASTWFGKSGDTRYNDITARFLGLENWVADINGDYTHVDD